MGNCKQQNKHVKKIMMFRYAGSIMQFGVSCVRWGVKYKIDMEQINLHANTQVEFEHTKK